MTKKSKSSAQAQSQKSKPIKNGKQNNKEMFAELKTHEEKKIGAFDNKNNAHGDNERKIDVEDDENSCSSNVEAQITKDNQDI